MHKNLKSDLWTNEQLEQARIEYLKPRTVRELINWLQEIDNYDLVNEASSLWPVDYSTLGHPITLKKFSFQKIAEIKSINLSHSTNRILEDFKNTNINNIQVLSYRQHNKERKFLIESGFDRETHSIKVTKTNYPDLYNLSEKFGFKKFSSTIQYQPPGGIFPRHTDFLQGMWDHFSTTGINFVDMPFDPITKSPVGYYAVRAMIALTEWMPGQMFGFENENWTEWHPGDVITFDWAHARHFTANASYVPRAYLKVSGIVDKTHWIYNNINNNLVTEL